MEEIIHDPKWLGALNLENAAAVKERLTEFLAGKMFAMVYLEEGGVFPPRVWTDQQLETRHPIQLISVPDLGLATLTIEIASPDGQEILERPQIVVVTRLRDDDDNTSKSPLFRFNEREVRINYRDADNGRRITLVLALQR